MRLMRTLEEKFENFGKLLSFLEGTSDCETKRIWVVSAYYDIPSIKQLIDHIKSRNSKKLELLIVIGTINSGELAELKKIQKMEFGNKFKKGSGIRVTHCGYLFHSKGYLVETNRNAICAIGSMNLTQNGLKKNEEILTYSRDPAFVESFEKYVDIWHGWSKEIRAVSENEEGILWLPKNKSRNNAHDKFRQKSPEFPDIDDEPAVRRYFKKLGLHRLNNRKKLGNEREFTLALYNLLFQECRFRSDKHDGVTWRSIGAGWRSGVRSYRASKRVPKPGKNKRHFAYSARFGVTSVSLPNQTYHCDVWVYLDNRISAGGSTLFLNVRVENKQKKLVDDLQLYVSKLRWENIWNNRGWKVYHDGSMGARKSGKGIESKTVLSAVRKARRGRGSWIEKNPKGSKAESEWVHLGKLHIAKKATWKNKKSREFLARLLHYSVIRADIKFRGKK